MALRNVFFKAILGALMVFAAFGSASSGAELIDFTNGAFIQTSGPTSVPYAAVEFCQRIKTACVPTPVIKSAVVLTEGLWKQLLLVNSTYNTAIKPVTDMDQYGVADFWTYPDSGNGDCEDYQLAKQRELIRDGWPASDLLMTVVRDGNGDGHAVLLVRTDRGDFVLDNEDGLVRLWSDTSFKFLKRQSQSDPTQWVGLVDSHQTTMVANR